MHRRIATVIAGLVGAAVLVGQMRAAPTARTAESGGPIDAPALAGGQQCNGPAPPVAGADLVVCRIGGSDGSDFNDYSTFQGISAYAFGTTACNNGNTIIDWVSSGENAHLHPVIAQNLYRLKDGRFEQIGMSWIKHGFCAGDAPGCGVCTPDLDCATLAIGCSDTYTADINGNTTTVLGPRTETVTASSTMGAATPQSPARGA